MKEHCKFIILGAGPTGLGCGWTRRCGELFPLFDRPSSPCRAALAPGAGASGPAAARKDDPLLMVSAAGWEPGSRSWRPQPRRRWPCIIGFTRPQARPLAVSIPTGQASPKGQGCVSNPCLAAVAGVTAALLGVKPGLGRCSGLAGELGSIKLGP